MTQPPLLKTPTTDAPALKLPPQQFGEILASLRGNSDDRNSEKRRTTRMSVSAKVLISPYDGKTMGARITTLAKDISIEGLGLLSGVAIKRGDSFVARLPRNETQTYFLVCRVVYSGLVADGVFTLGSQFTGEIAPDIAHQLEDASDSELQRLRAAMLT